MIKSIKFAGGGTFRKIFKYSNCIPQKESRGAVC